MDKIIVLGAGGHAKIIIDILESGTYYTEGLVNAEGEGECLGKPVLGTDEVLTSLYNKGITNAAIGIGNVGNPEIRNKVYENAKKIGFAFPNVIHPSAVIAGSARLGEAGVFAAGCVVNPEAEIGDNVIVNTNATVEHDVKLGYGVHIAPGAVVLGAAEIGDNTFIGAGAVINPMCKVGKNCIVGSGAVVIKDVPDNSTVVGVPVAPVKDK